MEPWDFNLRHLRAFAETFELGTVVAAAHAIHLSQPAVTQAIARLETQIGEVLFARRPDGMTPLATAQTLHHRAVAALSLVGSPRVTSTQARAFLALAKAGSYTEASARVRVSKASLHRSVNDLELAVGAKLVERRGRGLELSRRGRLLARALRLAQAELEAALVELAAQRGDSRGRISIGAMPLCRARLLPAAIVAFQASHPGFAVSVAEGSHNELIDPLRDGELDMLIGALRTPSPGPDLIQSPLMIDHPVLIARRNHPATAGGITPSLAQLAQFDWVVPPLGVPLREHWRMMFLDAGIEPPAVVVESGSVMTIRQILMRTDCLTILSPDQVTAELEAGWLTIVRETPSSLRRTIGFTLRRDWRPPPQQAAFILALQAAGTMPSELE
jgi:LysR family transcriptional regulator of gallate degradation